MSDKTRIDLDVHTSPAGRRSEKISGRLDPALLDRIDEVVESHNLRNRSEFIRRAAVAYLETMGESTDNMVTLRLPHDHLDFIHRLVELGEAEGLAELVRTAVRDHLRSLASEVKERNELLAYYGENRHMRLQGGYTP